MFQGSSRGESKSEKRCDITHEKLFLFPCTYMSQDLGERTCWSDEVPVQGKRADDERQLHSCFSFNIQHSKSTTVKVFCAHLPAAGELFAV